MALAHFSKVFGITDGKIKKVTADPAGGSTTLGSAIDVPGVKSVTLGGTVNTKRLRGDMSLLDVFSVLEEVSATINFAKQSLDMLPVTLGGTTTDSGTTPNQVASWLLSGGGSLGYFQFEGATPANGADFVGGDVHLLLYKCVLSGFPGGLGFAEEDYELPSLPCSPIPRLSDGKWMNIVFNETAVSIT